MPRFPAIAAALLISGIAAPAHAVDCECSNISAMSTASGGTCSRTESGNACEITWDSGGTTKVGNLTYQSATEIVARELSSRGDLNRPFSFGAVNEPSDPRLPNPIFRIALTAVTAVPPESYGRPGELNVSGGPAGFSVRLGDNAVLDSYLILAGGLLLRRVSPSGTPALTEVLADIRRSVIERGGADALAGPSPKEEQGPRWSYRVEPGCFRIYWREINTAAIIMTPFAGRESARSPDGTIRDGPRRSC